MNANRSRPDKVGIILAAGRGSRMRSRTPKPLHQAAGRELIRYPLNLLERCGIRDVVVVASPGNIDSISAVVGDSARCVVQPEANGTADAVSWGLSALEHTPELVMVMAADTPLVRTKSALRLIEEHAASPDRRMTILTARDAFGPDLGHIQRAEPKDSHSVGPVAAIVESADRDDDGFAPAEVNTGVYCFDGEWLTEHVARAPKSASGETYLTALVEIGAGNGDDVVAAPFAWPDEAMGVNDRQQLAAVSTVLRDRINSRWMLEGVTIIDSATTYIDADVNIGVDTVIQPNTMLCGRTVIGDECEIGPNSVVRDSTVAERCRIVGSTIEESTVHADVTIGPYSHLRPGAVIESDAHLGNFVEVKNSRIGASTAAGHFCYLGDADIGPGVNIGAGAITCNYDGVSKHRTTVGEGAFIGCDTMLIAPVSVGAQALTGAGSVVNRDVPDAGRVAGVPARILSKRNEG